ncbi:MAG: M1 family metallopeptidase [Microscillaceae bacterium]|jgi:hypothetical protein|nr:M1 family metallopeptidase [Microscillaceae bacterium]
MKKLTFWLITLSITFEIACGQVATQSATSQRWQQRADYTMDIDMDVKNHRYNGKQKIVYTNNSPDTLYRAFYHLYFNAFQPGSAMDVRSRWIKDPDPRVRDRISKLKENEIGYQKINTLTQDGKPVSFSVEGSILEITLAKPILPNSQSVFEMTYQAQVPIQIRRSGRNSAEGVDYSMAQWYPKMCEYDQNGWHPNPYIAREFYGIWGDFEVKITIDSSYVIGGTGYLQNPQEIGHGYQDKTKPVQRPKTNKLTWHFKAPMVHDFVWAADTDYRHDIATMNNGMVLHFLYLPRDQTSIDNWKKLPATTIQAFEFMNKNFGQYPYKQYSVIQGGDGGMEYPMATLITGGRDFGSLKGVTNHELIHSWFQGTLATNEALYAWMDEGFNEYAGDELDGGNHSGAYQAYFRLVDSGVEEALTTHADHFNTNYAYSTAAYVKGNVYLHQLAYVIGKENLAKGMLRYYETWKFKHPTAQDLLNIMEKQSGLVLDWYNEYFVNSTATVDYGIKSVSDTNQNTLVTLERIGRMPMPIDLEVTYKDGSKEIFYIPLDLMRGEKPTENTTKRTLKKDWTWTYTEYPLLIARKSSDISKIEIDPSQRMADINRTNNSVAVTTPVKEETPDKGKEKDKKKRN